MENELNKLMQEHEEFLEEALDAMEYGAELTQDQVNCIRQACGKPNRYRNKPNETLTALFDDFGQIFGK